MSEEKFAVKTTTYVDMSEVADTICAALEGGSTYWCHGFKPERYVEGTEWGHEQVALGVPFRIMHDDEVLRVDNSKAHMQDALSKMARVYSQQFWDLTRGLGDADTGDTLFQIICFGEVVYG